jgi:hypothetical protein
MITRDDLDKALQGEDPPLGHPLSLTELGRALAFHRRGTAKGQPYRKQTIDLYRRQPHLQGEDFEEAFLSWRAAMRLKLAEFRLRVNHLDELLDEVQYVQQLGEGEPKALLVIGELPPQTLISVNGIAKLVACRAELRLCACGRWFVPRAWNHKRCTPGCRG